MYNFWNSHGLLFIFLMFWFPRLTMLLATTVGGGFLYWVGWLLMPRLTVAIIATILYHEHNVALLVCTWIWAFAGEGAEKTVVRSSGRRRNRS
jgi:uncharacterized membrane protein YGL010W